MAPALLSFSPEEVAVEEECLEELETGAVAIVDEEVEGVS